MNPASGTIPAAGRPTASSSAHYSYALTASLAVVLPLMGVVLAARQAATVGVATRDLVLFAVLYVVTMMGTELGYHRYLTHRAFQAKPWLRALLAVTGSMAGNGPPIWWAAIHRRHHQHSDSLGDPHSPNLHGTSWRGRLAGAWHSHIGWMFRTDLTASDALLYARDLVGDRRLLAIDRAYPLWILLGLAVPAAIGGAMTGTWTGAWTGFLWGGLVRHFFVQHGLWWGILTVCHRWGTRPFVSGDDSVNNACVAPLLMGGGWHNNHHAFPYSARAGLRWWEVDFAWWALVVLERLGWAWDVRVPTPAAVEAARRVPAVRASAPRV